MKTFFKMVWRVKYSILYAWLFFLILAFSTTTTYNVIQLILISFGYAIFVTLLAILILLIYLLYSK
jgi:hypothetical protein